MTCHNAPSSEELEETEFITEEGEEFEEEDSHASIKSEINDIIEELLNIWGKHECHKLEILKIKNLLEHSTTPPSLLDYNLDVLRKICWQNTDFLPFSPSWNFRINEIGKSLATDCVEFCEKNRFTPFKTLAFLSIFYALFVHIIEGNRNSYKDVIHFFKKTVLRHAVQDPPKSLEIFTLNDCELIFEYFKRNFVENLPLLRAVTTENCVIRIKGKFEIVKPDEVLPAKKKKAK